MRLSILLWSTVSGAVLGVFVDAVLLGGVLLLSALVPAGVWAGARVHSRWILVAATVVLAAIPLAMSILGYLEGQLKSV